MAADDFMESEVAIAAAATAALCSPRVREVARKGAVYGMAGVLTAGRVVVGVAREAGRGVSSAMPAGGARSAATSTPSRTRTATTRRTRSGPSRSKPAARSSSRSGGTGSTGNAAASGSDAGPPTASAKS